ncbi:hypothetical protein BH23ACT12_BH23ACT12_03320 [soil metagenome]
MGRSVHSLGPIEVIIDAPRELVYETISSPYLGRTPKALKDEIQVLERSGSLVVYRGMSGIAIVCGRHHS